METAGEGETMMNRIGIFAVTVVFSGFLGAAASAQVTGTTTPQPGLTAAEAQQITSGLSVRRDILGEAVLNDRQEHIGKVEDVVITSNNNGPYVVVNASRFVGTTVHNVIVPLEQLQISGDDVVLPGATRETLRAAPSFELTEQR
jgi:sporulation protein YlmC with PRC-barrel domain